jgi:hypothetical protein
MERIKKFVHVDLSILWFDVGLQFLLKWLCLIPWQVLMNERDLLMKRNDRFVLWSSACCLFILIFHGSFEHLML